MSLVYSEGRAIMELLQLKYFKTVADIGKISDAAQTLFISAPALSTSISRLEKELGVRLFDRYSNRVVLNQHGKIFLRYVNQVFSSLECAKTELQQSMLAQLRRVRIASVGTIQVVDLITAFSEEFPGFTLQCTGLHREELEQKGLPVQYSFLLASEEIIPAYYAEKLDSVALFENHPVLVVHKDHPLAKKKSVDVKELAGENILMPIQNYPLGQCLRSILKQNNIPVPSGNGYSYLVTQQMVAKNLGVAFTSKRTEYASNLPLCHIPISNDYEPWVTRIYWRKNHVFSEEEMIFRTYVVNYYRSDLLEN